MRRRLAVPAILAAAGLLLGACSGSSDHDGMNAEGDGSSTTVNIPDGAEFNAADVGFAQGMIPHHGQAVVMADMALSTSTNPEVKALAEEIKAAQSLEIEEMTTWLSDWDQTVPAADDGMDDAMEHSGGMKMSGMMSAADMGRLSKATGTDFDRMFLEMMIRHHEGAIEAAQQELAKGRYQPTKALAQAIVTGQQAEITEMKALITGLPA